MCQENIYSFPSFKIFCKFVSKSAREEEKAQKTEL
jgi:hypothetical protein